MSISTAESEPLHCGRSTQRLQSLRSQRLLAESPAKRRWALVRENIPRVVAMNTASRSHKKKIYEQWNASFALRLVLLFFLFAWYVIIYTHLYYCYFLNLWY